MYRYVSLVWDGGDSARAAEAARLVDALRARAPEWTWLNPASSAAPPSSGDCLALFHAGARCGVIGTEVLAADGGAVFGTLFRAGSPGPRVSLDDDARRAILASQGTVLLTSHWGRYVAIVRSASGGMSVLRDPTGGLPCLLALHRGVWLLFSDVEDALALGFVPSINWRYVRALIEDFGLQAAQTGLEQVTEVQPGESVELRGDTLLRTQCWNPLEIALAEPIEAPAAAAAALREAVRQSVRAWACCHPRILHRLSGGLDSAIVLAALHEAPGVRVTCLNYFGEGPQEDERAFARRAAARAGRPLIEQPHEPDRVRLEAALGIARTARPYFYLYAIEHGRDEAELAASLGATALFSGGGGDALFHRDRAALAAADALHRHGLGRQLLRAALDAAIIERISIWSVLARALRGRGRCDEAPDRATAEEGLAHPWLRAERRAPPGKVWQVRRIGPPLPYHDPLGRPDDPESVQPLLQQQVIETCLRIPTPTLVSGGWDRAIARRAFLHDIPPEIVRRRGKGASTATAQRVFESNLPFLRDLLLDGLLVREGLLQRRELQAALVPGASLRDTGFVPILLQHLATEAWLRRWSDRH